MLLYLSITHAYVSDLFWLELEKSHIRPEITFTLKKSVDVIQFLFLDLTSKIWQKIGFKKFFFWKIRSVGGNEVRKLCRSWKSSRVLYFKRYFLKIDIQLEVKGNCITYKNSYNSYEAKILTLIFVDLLTNLKEQYSIVVFKICRFWVVSSKYEQFFEVHVVLWQMWITALAHFFVTYTVTFVLFRNDALTHPQRKGWAP